MQDLVIMVSMSKIEHDLDGCEQPKGLKNGPKVGRQRLLAALVSLA